MVESVKRAVDFIVQVLVTRRELVAKQVEQGEVDMIGSVRVSRMGGRFDTSGIVDQQVEDVMAFRFMRPDHLCIDR